MTPKKIADTSTQIALRLDGKVLEEADDLGKSMARPGFTYTRADILRAAVTRGLSVMKAEKASRLEATDDPAMSYEESISYVHDRCARFGANGDATTDKFQLARMTDDWAGVSKAFAGAVRIIYADASFIKWTDEDRGLGGIRPNFEYALERASGVLDRAATVQSAYLAIAHLVTALKAVTLKASGKIPKAYRGTPRP